jgi:hypothetical protein
MASASKRTDTVRRNKKTLRGKVRKAKNRNKGTTKSAAKLFGDE